MPNANLIIFANSHPAWGGGEKWQLATALAFRTRGHHVRMLVRPHSVLAQKAKAEGLETYEVKIGNLSFLNPYKMFRLVRWFMHQRPSAVVLGLPSDVKTSGMAAWLAHVPVRVYRRGMPHPLRGSALNRFLVSRVLTAVVANSQAVARSLVEGNKWFPRAKLHVIPNHVPALVEAPKLTSHAGFVLGHAGRLVEQKNQSFLLQVAKKLVDQGVEFQLQFAGEGPMREKLQQQTMALGLEQRVQWLGHISDMRDFFSKLDLFLFPSLFEGHANTLVEALQAGVPVIAHPVDSNPEIIEDGKCGFLTPVSDVTAMVDKILLLQRDATLRANFSEEGRSRVQQQFTEGPLIGRWEELLVGKKL